jgi:hypothetical protein
MALSASRGGGVMANAGPALIGTWLTVAVMTPLVTAAHAFNWFTALLLAGAWPIGLWLLRHRGTWQVSLRNLGRVLVFRLVARQYARSTVVSAHVRGAVTPFLIVLLPVVMIGATGDVRLPVPADFDTLDHMRQVLDGTPRWDPLASLGAVLTRIAMADPLLVAGAFRLVLVTACGAAIYGLIAITGVHRAIAGVAAGMSIWVAPWTPAATWAVALIALVGLMAVARAWRDGRLAELGHAAAALALLSGQVAAFGNPAPVLFAASDQPVYLEHGAALREARRIARSSPDDDWILVAPPEQRLELRQSRVHDLAAFVSRFAGRTGDSRFRFGLAARRVFVFVEITPLDVSRPAPHVQFVSDQSAAYRVPRERARLARQARDLCDAYARTHAGAEVVYDDAVLRVYRFDL